MVVEHRQPRRGRVRGLQVRIGLVLRVPLPVVGQRHRFRPDMIAHIAARGRVAARGVLVLVITKVHNKIRMLVGKPAVRGEPSVLSLVQMTTPSGTGSPEATPSVNGSAGAGPRRRSPVNAAMGSAASTTAPLSSVRRLDTDTAKSQRTIFRAG
jgi:hypothetical protein